MRLLLALAIITPLLADGPSDAPSAPWFTGSLLSSSGSTNGLNVWNFQPYVSWRTSPRQYDNNWSLAPVAALHGQSAYFALSYGLTSWLDIEFDTVWHQLRCARQHSAGPGDSLISLNMQVMEDRGCKPDLLISLYEMLPTGSFNRLHHETVIVGARGNGCFQPVIGLYTQKVFHYTPKRVYRLRGNIDVFLPGKARVNGFNAYGGGEDTQGSVLITTTVSAIFAYEIQLTQNWVFATDWTYSHSGSSKFKGTAGTDPDGLPAVIGFPSADLFTVAPAIEYNFSENYGLLGGIWVTLAGRNNYAFIGGLLSFNASF